MSSRVIGESVRVILIYFLELEVVEVLLEEETLVSSSSHWLMGIWKRLVIWVCNQWRMRKWLRWMEFLRVHLGHLVIRLGLEMEALVDAMEVYGG
ncbi:hypothetical protein Tco_1017834 [Tanacetum coccineum]|uniref:Uncharacterized protein n=1 Tax=Tanacetum coccineum TaxID=301880 RepID=A0ABQ5FT07_9ASTR